jgi:hypothetical protein
MGLDMYAYSRAGSVPAPVDFDKVDDDTEIFYWRKHPNLHGWMQQLYKSKGGTDEAFDLSPVQLTGEDLDALEAAINQTALPETKGFFFGRSFPEDKVNDLAFIAKARQELKDGKSVFYTSWW